MPMIPLHRADGTKGKAEKGDSNPYPPNDPWSQLEVDEHGAELAREARVWRVYVGEADKHDAELVDGWNKSMDVLLVFAALFSAILTAFLIESSGMLKQDPNDVSAAALVSITQILLVIANNSSTDLPVPGQIVASSFVTSRNAIIINILWYLSLSLGLATSFLAMLAKDWCYTFNSKRTGHLRDQALRRQRKWKMIQHWKMQELLQLLPSLMQLALVSFAAGLSIYLWDMNHITAIPVICVSGAVFLFYVWTSITAVFIQHFPYTTILSLVLCSKFMRSAYTAIGVCVHIISFLVLLPGLLVLVTIQLALVMGTTLLSCGLLILCLMLFVFIFILGGYFSRRFISSQKKNFRHLQEGLIKFQNKIRRALGYTISMYDKILPYLEMLVLRTLKPYELSDELTTGLALSWLIEHCETPSAVNIALQSIAGASQRIPKEPLNRSQATAKILQRMMSSDLKDEENRSTELYKRGLQFLGSNSISPPESSPLEDITGDVEVIVWDLKLESERQVAHLIKPRDSVDAVNFQPTVHNLEAITIGNAATIHTLQRLTEPGKGDAQTLYNIARLFSDHLSKKSELHSAAMQSLANAAALHASCLSRFDHRLASTFAELGVKSFRPPALSTIPEADRVTQAAFVICTLLLGCFNGDNSETANTEVRSRNRTRTTICTLIDIYSLGGYYPTLIVCVGYLEILSNPGRYGFDLSPRNQQSATLKSEWHEYFDHYTRGFVGRPEAWVSATLVTPRDEENASLLKAINDIYTILGDSDTPNSVTGLQPPLVVYHFVVRLMCSASSASQEGTCKKLLARFGFPQLSAHMILDLEPSGDVAMVRRKMREFYQEDTKATWKALLKNKTGKVSRPPPPQASLSWSLIKLLGTTYHSQESGPQTRHFAATQLWLLMHSVIDLSASRQRELLRIIEQRANLPIESVGVDMIKRELEEYIMSSYRRREDLDIYSPRVIRRILEGRRQEPGELRSDIDYVCQGSQAEDKSCSGVGLTWLNSHLSEETTEARNDIDHVSINSFPVLKEIVVT